MFDITIRTQALERARNITVDTEAGTLVSLLTALQAEYATYQALFERESKDYANAIVDVQRAAAVLVETLKTRRVRELEAFIEASRSKEEKRQEAEAELAKLLAG